MSDSGPAQAVLLDIAALLPPEFELLELLGEGGHGIVVKALYKPMQQHVALKLMKNDGSQEMERSLKRLRNEAKILARLNHRNIVRVFQMGACLDQTPFLVCEYLDGVSLDRFLQANPQPGPGLLVDLFSQILDALACAHENGLLHRDIKPSNIMIVKDLESNVLEVKLLDFGIARDFVEADSTLMGLTRTMQISGSAPYMSPEQCQGQLIDHRSDLYSVACVLYECLSGRAPFVGDTPMHTRYLQIHENPQIPADDKFAQTSGRAAIYRLALMALSKNPEQRPDSALSFKSQILQALPLAKQRELWTSKSRFKNAGKIYFAAALILALLLTTFVCLYLQNKIKPAIPAQPNHKKIKVLAKEGRASSILNKIVEFKFENNSSSMQKGLDLHKQLCELIESLEPSDKGLLYMSYRQKAEIELKLGLSKQALESLKASLSYCRMADGQPSSEAIESYASMAMIYSDQNNSAEAEKMAKKGLEVARLAVDEENGNYLRLELASMYDVREKLATCDCYQVLADQAQRKKLASEELDLRWKQERSRLNREYIFDDPVPFFRILDLTAELKGVQVAVKLLRQREEQVQAFNLRESGNFQLLENYRLIISWYLKNGFKSDARRALLSARSVFSGAQAGQQREDLSACLDHLTRAAQ